MNKGIKNTGQSNLKKDQKRTRRRRRKGGVLQYDPEPEAEPEPDVGSEEDEGSPAQDDPEDGNDVDDEHSPAKNKAPSVAAAPEIKVDKPHNIQILDLHSKNPIISYGEEIFACEWARNIGTEFLFMEHDEQNPLPVLRHLQDGVDLIAVSSTRIMSRPIILEPKFGARSSGTLGDGFDRSSEPLQSKSEKKHGQATFLEQLRAIKKSKGEEDNVTMITKKHTKDLKSALCIELKKKRAQERTRLNKVIKERQDMGEVEAAYQRLKAMDEEAKRYSQPSSKVRRRKSKVTLAHDHESASIGTPNNGGRLSISRRRGSKGTDVSTPQAQTQVERSWEDNDDRMDEDGLYDEDAPYDEDEL